MGAGARGGCRVRCRRHCPSDSLRSRKTPPVKAKTIKAVLRKKMDEWLASIEDEAVRKRVKNHTIVTGGCIASMLLREPVNDFDVYFTDYETALTVANYYVARFQP